MYLWYSSMVVAPTHRSSPRARAGLSIFEASIAPWAAPAPTTVCSSSINRITSPSAALTSSMAAFKRSSNSPRNLDPAIMAPISRATTRFPERISGTSFVAIFWARPSTMAVFPTPASPIITGLFLVRRERIWITRRISESRPITGSNLPSRANLVISLENFSRAL